MTVRKEVKIGLTGIVALALLFWGIKFLKGVNLWESQEEYHIVFRNAKGLTKSSTVFADGYSIGIVDNIEYLRPGAVLVSVSVNSGVKIPHGTVATLSEAMLGGCTLNMAMGPNPAHCLAPGDTLQGADASGLMDGAADLMPKLEILLGHVDTLVQTLSAVVANPDIAAILANAKTLTDNLNHSSEALNTLLEKDMPTLASTFTRTGQNLDTLTASFNSLNIEGTLAKVDATLEGLQEVTTKLNSPQGSVGMLLNDTTLHGNINGTINSATELLQDLKAHPKRYINISVFGGKSKD